MAPKNRLLVAHRGAGVSVDAGAQIQFRTRDGRWTSLATEAAVYDAPAATALLLTTGVPWGYVRGLVDTHAPADEQVSPGVWRSGGRLVHVRA